MGTHLCDLSETTNDLLEGLCLAVSQGRLGGGVSKGGRAWPWLDRAGPLPRRRADHSIEVSKLSGVDRADHASASAPGPA